MERHGGWVVVPHRGFEGCSRPDRMGGGVKLGRIICGGGDRQRVKIGTYKAPPAAMEVCPSDRL